MIVALDLVICNQGNTPTFECKGRQSMVDVTMVSAVLAAKITRWTVEDKPSLSDHNYISFSIHEAKHLTDNRNRNVRWKINYVRLHESLNKPTRWEVNDLELEESANNFAMKIKAECGEDIPSMANKRRSVHWWSKEISDTRKKVIHLRRIYTRKKRRHDEDECTTEHEEWRKAKLELTKAIKRAKADSWRKLCDLVEQEPWGKPYKVVMGKLTRRPPVVGTNQKDRLQSIINGLFPVAPIRSSSYWPVSNVESPRIQAEELVTAVRQIKNSTAPGLDGITNEALKTIVRSRPEILLRLYNRCMEEGCFPITWKRARLVLIKKGDKPSNEPSSFRPLCLLDCTGKLFEKIIDNRLRDILEDSNEIGLSDNQFGFRRGRSTIDALSQVIQFVEESRTKQKVGMVTLDIKNAFNTASWEKILEAMMNKDIPLYIRRLVSSYLSDRTLFYQHIDGELATMQVSCGVPQGSVLGPTLWNILYDDLLRVTLPVGARYLAFADDLAIIARGADTIQFERILTSSIEKTVSWLHETGLQIAVHKTEAIVISKARLHNELNLQVQGVNIIAGRDLKYLGDQLENKLSFTAHARRAAEKANVAVQKISRILPNVSAAKQGKRVLMANMVHSLLLYGAPVWAGKISRAGINELLKVQRRITLRVACAYCTVSTDALNVVTSTPPLDLQAQVRKLKYENRRDLGANIDLQAEGNMIRSWQVKWDLSSKGRWTHRMIPDISKWLRRKHGSIDFWITQALTGHGCFASYLHKYKRKKLPSPECWFCGHGNDDAEHTLFWCDAWETRRQRTSAIIGITLTPENIVSQMLDSKEKWEVISEFIHGAMKGKEKEERRRQNVAN